MTDKACPICAHVSTDWYCPDCYKEGILTKMYTRPQLAARIEKYRASAALIQRAIRALEARASVEAGD